MLREDFLAYQRQWMESQERSATVMLDCSDDHDSSKVNGDVEWQDDTMIDQVLSLENRELEALITLLNEHPHERSREKEESAGYGSDEESYESIFMEILNSNPNNRISQPNDPRLGFETTAKWDNDTMDTAG
ncbi:MAG: hypothetical protein Q9219_005818 [cf. Caloplaca sp. 3 TL-2023]